MKTKVLFSTIVGFPYKNVGGNKEIVRNNFYRFLFNPNNHKELAELLLIKPK